MIRTARAAEVHVETTPRYRGHLPWLLVYGIGHHHRGSAFRQHVAAGKHSIALDLGYFGRRALPSFPMRVSIDHAHPQRFMRDMPADRWEAANIPLRDDYDPSGPIVLCGIGRKARVVIAADGPSWETRVLALIKATYPNTPILYRPKALPNERLAGATTVGEGPIEDAIRGASLVVVKHSNVAVDACIAGIPVVCEDGAASILYGNNLCKPVRPTTEQRLQFLQNLAYWQWRPEEALGLWLHLKQTLSD